MNKDISKTIREPKWVDHAICFNKSSSNEPVTHSKHFYPPEYQKSRTTLPRGNDVMDTKWKHWII